MPPLVFKTLGSDSVTIRPFKVHKTQVLSYTSGSGSNSPELNVATGIALADVLEFDPNTSPTNEDGSYQEPLYESIEHLFYDSALYTSRSVTFAAGGSGDRGFTPSGSVYVVNVAQSYWGERIRKGTFVLDAPPGSGSIIEDAAGRLYVSGSDNVVGNVFYGLGIAVVNRATASGSGSELVVDDGLFIAGGDTVRVTFDATQTLYEYQIIATINPGEFNYSINPSARGKFSGSTGQTFVVDEMASGTLSPYITEVGLYNDYYELVAVAKLPRPIKRLRNTQQSFVIRFDA